MKGTEKSLAGVGLMVLICTALLVTASATSVDFGKSNQLFTQKVGITRIMDITGNNDAIKVTPYKSSIMSFAVIKPQANAPYFRNLSSYRPANYSVYQTTFPVSYPTITPVPEQGTGTIVPGSSGSALGGFIIRGTEGDWINMRSNFYNPSMGIYDGRWHYHVGTVPAYWENMALPGSYTIQVAHRDTDVVYYCETVIVYPGQTVVIQANSLCPLCSNC